MARQGGIYREKDAGYCRYSPVLIEVGSVSSVLEARIVGLLEGRTVLGLVESSVHAGGSVALSLGLHAKVVHSVGVLEEFNLCGVSLDVAPAAALPTTRHEVQLRVHRHFCVHLVELTCVD